MKLSFKTTVNNRRNFDIIVHIEIQGVDEDGFEVEDFSMGGMVPAKRSRDITDSLEMAASEFRKIVKWKISDLEEFTREAGVDGDEGEENNFGGEY